MSTFSTPERKTATVGPFHGVDQRNLGGEGLVPDALNVDFGDDGPRRRPGRVVIATPAAGRRILGLFEHVSLRGDRQLLVVAGPADQLAGGAMRVGLVDEGSGALVDLTLPAGYDDQLPGFATVAQIPFNGHSLIADTRGRLLDFDGAASLVPLAGMQGRDAANGVVGAWTYLSAPPTARLLTRWRNRAVAVDAQRIGLSMDDGDFQVPDAAPVGGPNVWPATTRFGVTTDASDEILGVTVRFDRLEVYGRRSVHAVDEDAVSPISKQIASQRGCVAPLSLQDTGELAFFLSDGAICSFDGARVTEISGPVQRWLDELVNWQLAGQAVSAHLTRRSEYRLWLPLRGSTGNALCVIYDYRRKTWRFYAAWYPFAGAGDVQPPPFDVTCACTVLTANNEELLYTGDSAGNVWLEDVGEDDAGAIFPAYFITPLLGNGSARQDVGDFRVECLWDGCCVGAYVLADGQRLEQALQERPLDVDARAIRAEQVCFDVSAAWDFKPFTDHYDTLRLPFDQVSGKVRLAVMLLGQQASLNVQDLAPGTIRFVEVTVYERPGRTP